MKIPVHRPGAPQRITLDNPLIGALIMLGNAEIEYRIRRAAMANSYEQGCGNPAIAPAEALAAHQELVRAAMLAWEDVKAARSNYEQWFELTVENIIDPVPF